MNNFTLIAAEDVRSGHKGLIGNGRVVSCAADTQDEPVDDAERVYWLFYTVWEVFIKFKFPTVPAAVITRWVDSAQIEIVSGELKCWYAAPVEWTEFRAFYDQTITAMNQALLDGINGVQEGEV